MGEDDRPTRVLAEQLVQAWKTIHFLEGRLRRLGRKCAAQHRELKRLNELAVALTAGAQRTQEAGNG